MHILCENIYNSELLETIALIKFNIEKHTNAVKFIIYILDLEPIVRDTTKQSITYYLKENKLNNINIVDLREIPTLAGDGIFFLQAGFGYNWSNINHSTNSRNSVVLFDIDGFDDVKLVESWYTEQKTEFKKTVKKLSSKIYKTTHEFIENFIEDLSNASCF